MSSLFSGLYQLKQCFSWSLAHYCLFKLCVTGSQVEKGIRVEETVFWKLAHEISVK